MGTLYDPKDGIVLSTNKAGIDYNDIYGKTAGELIVLSKNQIETIDLISEGAIQGLVTGTYYFSGVLGNVGWNSVSFSGFKVPDIYLGSGIEYLRSIYLNEVPVLNDDGKFNFQSFSFAKTNGKPNGDVLQTLSPYQTSSRTIGERLFGPEQNSNTKYPKYYRILNPDCNAAYVNIKIPSLYRSLKVVEGDADPGSLARTIVEYEVSYRPLYSNKIVNNFTLARKEKVFGKLSSSPYIKSTRINFPSDLSVYQWNTAGEENEDISTQATIKPLPDYKNKTLLGWEIKVERLTPDSTTSYLQNQTYVESITEIYGEIYTYPYGAMIRGLYDAQFFQGVPSRAYEVEGLKVKIPGNYNPLLKTYSTTGFATTNSGWNGQFATGVYYTDNPAWCYYDLLTNSRYGLGKYIDSSYVDKQELYNVSKYCDTLVADGFGGLEPRFTCNLILQSREEAYKVVNDMASIFRGLAYYSNGLIYVSQDRERDDNEIVSLFTNANVEEGNFNYSTSSRKNRHSVAIIRYNDPKNFYKPAIEYVEDFNAIRRYGIREIELTAFGCTSRGQAIRLGRWILTSDSLETESVNFTAGLEAARLKPGDVFKVFDYNRKLKRHGGRTLEISKVGTTGTYVVLDGPVDIEPNVEYAISFLTPSYEYNSSQVTGVDSSDYQNIRKGFVQKFGFSGWQTQASGTRTIINLFSGIDSSNYYISGYPPWSLELTDRYENYSGARYFINQNTDYYRLINIKETDIHKYEIDALQYNPQKFIEIESGLLFGRDSNNAPKIPATPKNLSFNLFKEINYTRIDYSFMVDDYSNIGSYRIYANTGYYPNNGIPSSDYLINTLSSNTTYGSYNVNNTGKYYFRVYSSNDIDGILSANYASGTVSVYDSTNAIQYITINSLNIVNNV